MWPKRRHVRAWSDLAVGTLDTVLGHLCRSLGPVILDLADRLESSNHGAYANAHLVGYFLDREPCFPQPYDFIAIEDPPRAPNRIPSLCAVGLGRLHSSTDAFADQFPLELSDCREDVLKSLLAGLDSSVSRPCEVAMKRMTKLFAKILGHANLRSEKVLSD